jgi:hypothetical protein
MLGLSRVATIDGVKEVVECCGDCHYQIPCVGGLTHAMCELNGME